MNRCLPLYRLERRMIDVNQQPSDRKAVPLRKQ